MSKIKFKKVHYPDGSFYPQIEEFGDELLFFINSYNDLWFLRQIKDICDHNKQEVNLIIPCLFDAQADRRFNKNESANLRLICEFINSMNFKTVQVFHPHNQEVVEALLNNVEFIDNYKFMFTVLQTISDSPNAWIGNDSFQNKTVLLSADAGGYKWIMKLADKLNWKGEVFSASKSRKFENEKSVITQLVDRDDFGGKDVIIADDLMIGGGTFIGLAKLLRERNVGRLYLAVSHITIPKPNPLVFEYFDNVFTTNSKDLNYFDEQNHPENLDVIQLF